jgi:hypothetical protein
MKTHQPTASKRGRIITLLGLVAVGAYVASKTGLLELLLKAYHRPEKPSATNQTLAIDEGASKDVPPGVARSDTSGRPAGPSGRPTSMKPRGQHTLYGLPVQRGDDAEPGSSASGHAAASPLNHDSPALEQPVPADTAETAPGAKRAPGAPLVEDLEFDEEYLSLVERLVERDPDDDIIDASVPDFLLKKGHGQTKFKLLRRRLGLES